MDSKNYIEFIDVTISDRLNSFEVSIKNLPYSKLSPPELYKILYNLYLDKALDLTLFKMAIKGIKNDR